MSSKEPLFDFFHSFSKIVFVIPLLIVVAAIFLKFQGNPVISDKVITATPTPTSAVAKVASDESQIKVDLVGPLACDYTDKTGTVSASIKNKNIYVELSQEKDEKILVNGDCLYKWSPVQRTGEKMCGVSSYISTYELLSSMGVADISTLLSMIPSSVGGGDASSLFKNVVKTCKKVEVADTVFTIPKNISFKETELPKESSGSGSNFGIPGLPSIPGL